MLETKQVKKIILTIDYNKNVRERIELFLSGYADQYYPIDTDSAENALEILKLVRPDVILCGALLPGMDGFQFCQFIKNHESLSNIPIILLFEQDHEEYELLGFEMGADDYMTKPFDSKELITKLKTILYRHKASTNSLAFRLEGSLLMYSVSDILQMPSVSNRPHGTLLIEKERTRTMGALYIGDGKIINARHKGNWGMQSACELINTKEGNFKYLPSISQTNVTPLINKPIMSVLLAAADFEDNKNTTNIDINKLFDG